MKDLDRAKKCMYVCTLYIHFKKEKKKKAHASSRQWGCTSIDRQNSWIHLAKDAQSLGMHAWMIEQAGAAWSKLDSRVVSWSFTDYRREQTNWYRYIYAPSAHAWWIEKS